MTTLSYEYANREPTGTPRQGDDRSPVDAVHLLGLSQRGVGELLATVRGPTVGSLIRRLRERLARRRWRQDTRAELMELPEDALRDIGLSREQIDDFVACHEPRERAEARSAA